MADQQQRRSFQGKVTKLLDSFGFIDDSVFFQLSSVTSGIVQLNDAVFCECQYSEHLPFKWNAIRVVPLLQYTETPGAAFVSHPQQQYNTVPAPTMHVTSAKRKRSESPQKRRYESLNIPKMETLKSRLTVYDLRVRFASIHVPSDLRAIHVNSGLRMNVREMPKPLQFNLNRRETPVNNNNSGGDARAEHKTELRHKYAVKVLFVSIPSLIDIYDRVFGSDSDSTAQQAQKSYFIHFNKLLSFVVTRNANDGYSMIGGKFDPHTDGFTDSEPNLIETAKRIISEKTEIEKIRKLTEVATFVYNRDDSTDLSDPSLDICKVFIPHVFDNKNEIFGSNSLTIVTLFEALNHQRYDQFEFSVVSQLIRESLIRHFSHYVVSTLVANAATDGLAQQAKGDNDYVRLAFTYFDANHCGYVTSDDLIKLFNNTGVTVSKRAFTALIKSADKVYYGSLREPQQLLQIPAEQQQTSTGDGTTVVSRDGVHYNVQQLIERADSDERIFVEISDKLTKERNRNEQLSEETRVQSAEMEKQSREMRETSEENEKLKKENATLKNKCETMRHVMEKCVEKFSECINGS